MSFLWFEQTLDLQAKNATDFSAAFFVCKFSDFQSAVLLRFLRVAGADELREAAAESTATLPQETVKGESGQPCTQTKKWLS